MTFRDSAWITSADVLYGISADGVIKDRFGAKQ